MGPKSFLIAALLAVASTAQAAIVSLTPSTTSVSVGQSLVFDVIVSGLGAGEAVGGFDLDVVFDDSVLSVASVSFGSALGVDGTDQFSIAVIGAGRIDVAAVSLLPEADLLFAQATPFSVATLFFDAIAPGMSDVRFDLTTFPGLLLSDAFGNPLNASVGTEASVTVRSNSVPEPSGLALVLLALGATALPRVARARKL